MIIVYFLINQLISIYNSLIMIDYCIDLCILCKVDLRLHNIVEK
jgi:hypothetical protein